MRKIFIGVCIVIAKSISALSISNAVSMDSVEFLKSHHLDFTPLSSVPRDRLKLELVEGGVTNFCFKCYDTLDSSNAIFIKHAKSKTRGFGGIELSPIRLFYEYEGMKSFAKYTPHLVPKTYYYDSEANFMILEYFDGFFPLHDLFVTGGIDTDAAKFIGTLMGRNHAKTLINIIPNEQSNRYLNNFKNIEHFEMWERELFKPTLNLLENLKNKEIETKENTELGLSVDEIVKKLNENNVFTNAIKSLQSIYLEKKETLVHADLHCNNILFKIDPDSDEKILKVIDFEKCCYGPAGLDLGVFLTNFIWFYLGHSNNTVRKNLLNQFLLTIDAYRAAFIIQFDGVLKTQLKQTKKFIKTDITAEYIINEIITDSIGFSALYAFFLVFTIPDVKVLDLTNVPGYKWGNPESRVLSVKRRLISLLHDLFELFLTYKDDNTDQDDKELGLGTDIIGHPIGIKSTEILQIFRKDDKMMINDHVTEFWY